MRRNRDGGWQIETGRLEWALWLMVKNVQSGGVGHLTSSTRLGFPRSTGLPRYDRSVCQ